MHTASAIVKYEVHLNSPNAVSASGRMMPTAPATAFDTVVVVPMMLERSSVLLVMAAGRDQNGISTAVKKILPVSRYITAVMTQRAVVPTGHLTKLKAINTQKIGPARRIHGRNRPHLLRVRSAMTPIAISENAFGNSIKFIIA